MVMMMKNMDHALDDEASTAAATISSSSSSSYSSTSTISNTLLHLPGFRFHPTEEELLSFYLKTMVLGNKFQCNNIIGFLNIYNHDPSDLPKLAKIGEREWYFFVARDRKHGSGGRPNRTTETGFWKATGSDRKIISTSESEPKRVLGLKKTLVFYQGRAPHGSKTNWVMNEYRLPDKSTPTFKQGQGQDIVLCKIYMKATSLKVLEQRAAMEEDSMVMRTASTSTSPSPSMSFCNQQTCEYDTSSYNWYDNNNNNNNNNNNSSNNGLILKREMSSSDHEDEVGAAIMLRNSSSDEEGEEAEEDRRKRRRMSNNKSKCKSSIDGKPNSLTELQLPNNLNTSDWTQDSFWMTQLSPWLLDHFTPYLLNY